MYRSNISVFSPTEPCSTAGLKKPFAVLLDTRDPLWADSTFLNQKVAELLDMGCRYYVCFGPQSEFVHDQIDDVILNRACEESVLTTFHDDEAITDVVNFFRVVAMSGMVGGLLLADDQKSWLGKL
ncbi:hypothetical protein GCM10011289_24940 [Paludibacterium paludis]|uniref:DUF7684 domain-containing protein n=2 Tax=Paludibacterium paludis TaxID=1225769 RepID=A0A918P513_9NEIS|nr:hypothetical protein GCM10011289_24940 [Paludibacterium paludis]